MSEFSGFLISGLSRHFHVVARGSGRWLTMDLPCPPMCHRAVKVLDRKLFPFPLPVVETEIVSISIWVGNQGFRFSRGWKLFPFPLFGWADVGNTSVSVLLGVGNNFRFRFRRLVWKHFPTQGWPTCFCLRTIFVLAKPSGIFCTPAGGPTAPHHELDCSRNSQHHHPHVIISTHHAHRPITHAASDQLR